MATAQIKAPKGLQNPWSHLTVLMHNGSQQVYYLKSVAFSPATPGLKVAMCIYFLQVKSPQWSKDPEGIHSACLLTFCLKYPWCPANTKEWQLWKRFCEPMTFSLIKMTPARIKTSRFHFSKSQINWKTCRTEGLTALNETNIQRNLSIPLSNQRAATLTQLWRISLTIYRNLNQLFLMGGEWKAAWLADMELSNL